MPAGRAFQVKIVGDVRDAKKSLQGMEKRMGGFAKAMKGVAGAMAAAFAVQKVAQFVGSAVEQAEKMQSAYAATEQIIEATGGAALLTARDIKIMNREMALSTGIAKDEITNVSNVLLTFKQISGDTFEQAQMLTLDMAAAMGTDAKSAAVQMGKALNDPVKGVTALARAGVQFTKAQKDQIDAMVEAGDIAGAQNLILEEMAGQFGGVAEATADSTAKIGIVKDEFMEAIGNVMLPLIDKLATWTTDVLLPAMDRFSQWVKANVPPWYAKYIKPTMDAIMQIVGTAAKWLSDIWAKHGDKIVKEVKSVVGIVIDYYTAVFDLYKRVIGPVVEWLADMWEEHGERITKALQSWWEVVSTILAYVYGAVKDLVRLVTALFKGDWAGAWQIAQNMADKFRAFVQELGPKILRYIADLVKAIGPLAVDIGRKLVSGLVSGVKGMASAVKSAATSAARAMMNAFIDRWNRLDPRISLPTMTLFGKTFGGQTSPDLLPDIPRLAKGGIVTGPTIAMIGEAGPEAVIPLGSNTGRTAPMSIVINTGVGDPVTIGETVIDYIRAYERAAGRDWRDPAEYSLA